MGKTLFAATQELPAIIEKVSLYLSPESHSVFSIHIFWSFQSTNTEIDSHVSVNFLTMQKHIYARALLATSNLQIHEYKVASQCQTN